MKLPKIFNAAFEQSLALEQDSMLQWMNGDMRRRGEKKRGIFLVCMTCVLIVINYGIVFLINDYTEMDPVSGQMTTIENKFLSISIFYGMLLFCIVFWGVSHRKRRRHNSLFWQEMNTHNFSFWGLGEVCLGMLSLFFLDFSFWFWIGLLLGVMFTVYVVARTRFEEVFNNMFGLDDSNKSQTRMKFFKKTMTVVSAITTLYMILKIIFPDMPGTLAQSFDAVGFVLLMLVLIVGFLLFEIYITFPLILQNYYHIKYAEEYRKHFGQSQLEWYGEKYYRKHIKGTAREAE